MQYQVYTSGVLVTYTDGVDTFRNGSRGGVFVTDKTLTALGFSGAENTDWINLESFDSDGGVGLDEFRDGVRNFCYVIDKVLDATGFFGTEDINWVNIAEIKPQSVFDVDGNLYTTVVMGSLEWMVENLKTTTYTDGTPIPHITDISGAWMAEDGTIGHDGAYVWYNNNITNKTPYGALYNWYALNNAHGLAPTGWRIPTNADLIYLKNYVSGNSGELKEMGTTHWQTPNTGATNGKGFYGVGAGCLLPNSPVVFSNQLQMLVIGSNELNSTIPYYLMMEYNNTGLNNSLSIFGLSSYKNTGFSVRCVRDV